MLARKARSLEDSSPEEASSLYRKAAELALRLARITDNREIRARLVDLSEKLLSRAKALSSGEKREAVATTGESLAEAMVLVEKPNVRWSDVADLEEAKKALLQAVIAVLRPDLFPEGGWRGILLYGPPGTGKTLLAKAVATELDLSFIYVDIAQLLSKWFGETEKNVKKVFEIARAHQPSIIFFDEIDAINTRRADESGVMIRVARIIQIEMDGLMSRRNERIIVLAATNHPWDIDPAILQRFERRIYVPLPNREARKEIFRIHLRNVRLSSNVDLDRLADLTEGYSGREIVQVIKYAQFNVLSEYLDSNDLSRVRELIHKPIKLRPLTMKDFLDALKKIKPIGIDTRKYELWASENK